MKITATKTKVVVIAKMQIDEPLRISIDGVKIEHVDQYTDLKVME